ncbi:unnamed protein product [Colias eurytheme]|nr:unnamed protein product [Colias eurytheme]
MNKNRNIGHSYRPVGEDKCVPGALQPLLDGEGREGGQGVCGGCGGRRCLLALAPRQCCVQLPRRRAARARCSFRRCKSGSLL